jgi:hypothetical protein
MQGAGTDDQIMSVVGRWIAGIANLPICPARAVLAPCLGNHSRGEVESGQPGGRPTSMGVGQQVPGAAAHVQHAFRSRVIREKGHQAGGDFPLHSGYGVVGGSGGGKTGGDSRFTSTGISGWEGQRH